MGSGRRVGVSPYNLEHPLCHSVSLGCSPEEDAIPMVFIPLAPLVPAWEDRYIPEVYGFIEKGIRHLQARYWLAKYVVISYVVHHNEDRSWDSFHFEAEVKRGRSCKPEDAVRAGDMVLRFRMIEAMVHEDPPADKYQVEEDHWYEASELRRFPPSIDMMAWETRGNGWNHITVFVGVVTLNPLHPFTGEDIGGMGRKHDLIPIFRMMGGDPAMAWMR